MKAFISLGLFVAAIQTLAADEYSFASQTQDNITSTIFLRARYYDPEIGRFLTKDPIGIQGGVNLYQYAFANPINFVDPLGEDALTHVFGGVKTVGGVLEIAVGGSFGVASSWTGIGGVAGGAVVLHGIDTTQSGFRQMISGEVVDSFTSQGLQSVGVPKTGANVIDAGIGVLGTGGIGVYNGVTKIAAASQLPEAAGMTWWQVALAIEKGSKALPKTVFDALGGDTLSALAKAA